MSERLAMTPLDQAIYALRVARPYVHTALCDAREDGQTWREETAMGSLDVVDATIARLTSEPSP